MGTNGKEDKSRPRAESLIVRGKHDVDKNAPEASNASDMQRMYQRANSMPADRRSSFRYFSRRKSKTSSFDESASADSSTGTGAQGSSLRNLHAFSLSARVLPSLASKRQGNTRRTSTFTILPPKGKGRYTPEKTPENNGTTLLSAKDHIDGDSLDSSTEENDTSDDKKGLGNETLREIDNHEHAQVEDRTKQDRRKYFRLTVRRYAFLRFE